MLRLIASAAYVEQELAAEFGKIPPAFLSIGVQPLYEAQIASFGPGRPIHLTIPDDFDCAQHDRERLQALGVIVVPVPSGLSLGASILYAINYIDPSPGPMQLLHGDTLVECPSSDPDIVAVHDNGDDYSWAAVDVVDGEVKTLKVVSAGEASDSKLPVLCGYFRFHSRTILMKSIVRAHNNFVAGLQLYADEVKLRAAPVETWHDFGHIQTYFRSRRNFSTARSFNALRIDDYTVRKSSDDGHKIRAEAQWFGSVPKAVKPFCARLIDSGETDGQAFYDLEYLYAPTLAELLVFASVGRATWRRILHSCESFLTTAFACKGPHRAGDRTLESLVVDKTLFRLARYAAQTGFDINRPTRYDDRPLPSLLRIAEDVIGRRSARPDSLESVMHGDFCFSNILYNSRAGRIIVIDPRGYAEDGLTSVFGDFRYDLAKLSHSVWGRYDHIVAGRYGLERDGSHAFALRFDLGDHDRWMQRDFEALAIDGVRIGSDEIRALTVGLFLSMLPMHADRPDRQAAFIANALRLYAELVEVRS